MFFSRKKPARSYDPATQQPALRCSICTGEQVAGFVHPDGHFEDVQLIRTPQELAAFRTRYGVGSFNEPCDERNAGRSQQQVDKGVFELFEEFLPFRHRWCGREFVRSVLVESTLGFRLTQAGIQIDTKRLRYGLRIGERRIDLRLRRGFCCLFEISRTGIAELGGLIFLAINHDDLLGSAAE